MSPSLVLAIVTLLAPIGVVGVGGQPGDGVRPAKGSVAPAPLTALAVAPDGKTALSGSGKGELRRYTLTDELVWGPAGTLDGSVGAIAFAPDGVAYAADDAGQIVRLARDAETATAFAWHPGGVSALAVVPATSKLGAGALLSGGADGVVRVWALDGTSLAEFEAHTGLPVTGLALAQERLWSVGWDRTLRAWQLKIPSPKRTRAKVAKLKLTLEAGPREITTLALDPEGQRLLSGAFDGSLRLWDLEARKPSPRLLTRRTHQEWVSGAVFLGDGARAAVVAAAEGGLVIVDRLDGRGKDAPEPTLELRKRAPIPSCVAAAGERLLVGGFDGTLAWATLPAPAAPKKVAK